MVLVSAYSASLSAFLTVDPVPPTIQNIEDLVSGRTSVKVGWVSGGEAHKFFRVSRN